VRQFDAADEIAVKNVVDEAVNKYGRLDIFFANAGILGQLKMFTEIEKQEFMATLNTNVARFVRKPALFMNTRSLSLICSPVSSSPPNMPHPP